MKPKATVCLPYIKGLSEPLKRVLEGLQIRTVLRPHRALKQSLVHPKNAIPDMKWSTASHVQNASQLCRRDQEVASCVREWMNT